MKQYYCPGGSKITVQLITTPGTCGIRGFEDDGSPDYDSNGTEHDYDAQTEQRRDGKILYMCEEGENHTLDECELREEE